MKLDSMTLANVLVAMQGRRVLVIGDVMLDQFVDGDVKRISPEAPVPILSKTNSRQMPGGAANVACNLAYLGCHVRLIGITGKDKAAQTLQDEIEKAPGLEFAPFVVDGRPTSVKTRFRAGGQQILRVDEEVREPLDSENASQLVKMITADITTADIIVLSDYAKGCLQPSVIAKVVKSAKAAGKMVIADPKLADFAAYADVDVLTPNLAELQSATQSELSNIDDIARISAKLAKEHRIGAIMATLSARGVLLASASGDTTHIPAMARDVFDVSGAGDTVVATFSASIAAGVDFATAASIANLAASIVVEKSGTAVVSPGEIIARLATAMPPTDWAHWTAKCHEWRNAGVRVGFTNGCFDVLHPGHMFLLDDAAQRCDKLIVGLNSDASVQQLKGPTRPLQNAETRAKVLASLPDVAGVVIFDEDTPLELITALQPDILVKGGDYKADEVVGGDVVRARGGEVIITSTLGSHSSTNLASR